MKIRCEIDLNTETSEYAIRFWNLTKPGSNVDYTELVSMLKHVFADVNSQVDESGVDSTDTVLKIVH